MLLAPQLSFGEGANIVQMPMILNIIQVRK